jgi:alkanesulfonate monooxygenase SsuD/methylene tetrahydromethanopterin reductase-like flavin-dependent oxidoreductase (luciferase family)
MAAVTKNLGFGITASTSYERPFLLARRFSTLDHFTRGRIGWNIVTSWSKSSALAMGLTDIVPHDERYAAADELMDLLYKYGHPFPSQSITYKMKTDFGSLPLPTMLGSRTRLPRPTLTPREFTPSSTRGNTFSSNLLLL